MGFFDIFKNLVAPSKGVVSLDTARKIKDDWSNIKAMLQGGTPSQLKQALITADKLLDTALKEVAVGEGMGERLKNARDIFDRSSYQKIWDAHKLRNNLVHQINFEPQHFMIREAVSNLQNALIKLGVSL